MTFFFIQCMVHSRLPVGLALTAAAFRSIKQQSQKGLALVSSYSAAFDTSATEYNGL
jgi:hypothetical protein